MDLATTTWIIGGFVTLAYALGGAVFKMLRDESKAHAEAIRLKADTDRLQAAEERWRDDLDQARTSNERLMDRQEDRHQREISSLASQLGSQIKASETNILAQLQLVMQMFSKD